jgi:hypothetical protein
MPESRARASIFRGLQFTIPYRKMRVHSSHGLQQGGYSGLSKSRRKFLQSLCRSALVLSFSDVLSLVRPLPIFGQQTPAANAGGDLGVTFIDVAKEGGLNIKMIFGGEHKNKYLLETTGCGVAFYDYDNDGWLDIFLVNGTRLEGFPPGQEPFNHLFKNNRDGTFTDVTVKAGLNKHTGWGQGVCIGDYDNDGNDDLFITYFGKNVLYHNNGDGTFTDVSEKSGVAGMKTRWATGCAFLDYDRDGKLDLFVANYIDLDLKTAPVRERSVSLQSRHGGVRASGTERRFEHPVSQQRRRHLHRCLRRVGHQKSERNLRSRRAGRRFR